MSVYVCVYVCVCIDENTILVFGRSSEKVRFCTATTRSRHSGEERREQVGSLINVCMYGGRE